jgi:hypothetical protein
MSGDDPDDAPHKPLRLGAAFWTAILFGLVCVVAGYLFARFGPALLAAHS